MILKVLVVSSLSLLVGLYLLLEDELLAPGDLPVLEDTCWAGDCAKLSDEVQSFTVNVTDSQLEEIHSRIASDLSRLVAPLPDSAFLYGFNTDYLREVAEYWVQSYDWRAEEKIINSFPHFTTNIDGLNIHFLHVKPEPVEGKKIVPLLLVHGWPGSVVEFLDIIPLLTTGGGDVMFEVVAPSIPGYGFSSAPEKMGYDGLQTARTMVQLMSRLGHERFYCQGGDWGSVITTALATLYPGQVLGLHLNMNPAATRGTLLKSVLASSVPGLKRLIMDEEDLEKDLFPVGFLLQETGYMHIQGTKPDTVGVGLSSSPLGLAAYIMEKFSAWTNPAWREKRDGGLGEGHPISRDRMISNVMVYWITNTITSSMRYYKENLSDYDEAVANTKVKVPAAFADFPHEIGRACRFQVRGKFPDLVRFTSMPTGGHFAAMEVPGLLAEDITKFVQTVESRTESENRREL